MKSSSFSSSSSSSTASTFQRFNVLTSRRLAFTLIEMLTVIAIIGVIAGLTVPVLKNFGKNDVSVSASRQLLDDIGYARQLAMSQRTTVYMVFVPTNFWGSQINMFTVTAGGLNSTQKVDATNLLDKQLRGYTFMALGAVGDQPGNHQWHYLASWQSLPDGAYIPLLKFSSVGNPFGAGAPSPFKFSDPVNNSDNFSIYPFSYTNTFPFPTQDSPPVSTFRLSLPFIAFNYLGQLSDYSGDMLTPQNGTEDQDYTGGGIDIPLAQGAVVYAKDPNTRALTAGSPQVVENPPGNTTNIAYNVVHIDPLTGRATLEYHKMQ